MSTEPTTPCICFETPHLDLLRKVLMADGDADYADSVLVAWQDAITEAAVGATEAALTMRAYEALPLEQWPADEPPGTTDADHG
jgi:hypothetical protein